MTADLDSADPSGFPVLVPRSRSVLAACNLGLYWGMEPRDRLDARDELRPAKPNQEVGKCELSIVGVTGWRLPRPLSPWECWAPRPCRLRHRHRLPVVAPRRTSSAPPPSFPFGIRPRSIRSSPTWTT